MRRPFIHGRSEDPDRFLADLLGVAAMWPARPAGARARQPAPEPPEHEEPDAGPPLPGTPSASPPLASPPPASSPAPASADSAVTATMALLVSDRAPLPVTCGEKERAAADPGVRDDYRSVCAIVPATPEPRLLVFFHGNDNYVTVERGGGSPPAAVSRPPRWADRTGRAAAAAKKAAALSYELDRLAAAQGALQQSPLSALPVKDPTVLVPEDAERTTGRFWAVPPRCQYGTARDASSGGAGTPGLGLLLSDCYARLRALASPAGRPYLPSAGSHPAAQPSTLRRVYLSGHSGGGKPLGEAAFSDVALPPAAAGAHGARPAELWLLDCTYGFGTRNHVAFCERWHRAGALAWRPDAARLVCVYRPRSRGSDTETEADDLRRALARVLGVSAASLLKLHDSAEMSSASMTRDVIPALVSSPVVFVRTNVGHDRIPTLFTPLLLRTAAS